MRSQFYHRIAHIFNLLLVSLLVSLLFAACTNGLRPNTSNTASANPSNTLDDIINTGIVRVAVPQDFPPFGMAVNNQPEGYDIEIAKLVAQDLGAELELVPVNSADRIPALQSNKVDLIISSLGANPERAKSIYFSIPYAPFFSGVYGGPATARVSSYTDLTTYTIGVTKGSLEDLEMTNKAPEGARIERYDDNSLTINAFLSGKVDLIATGNVVAAAIIQNNPEKNITSKFVMQNSPCMVGVRRGDVDLLQWVNVFIAHKRLDGELDQLAEQWFGEPIGELPAF